MIYMCGFKDVTPLMTLAQHVKVYTDVSSSCVDCIISTHEIKSGAFLFILQHSCHYFWFRAHDKYHGLLDFS